MHNIQSNCDLQLADNISPDQYSGNDKLLVSARTVTCGVFCFAGDIMWRHILIIFTVLCIMLILQLEIDSWKKVLLLMME